MTMGVLDPVRYAAVYAKVHARLGQLLDSKAWEDLLSAPDLERFLHRLAGTLYQDVVEHVRTEHEQEVIGVAILERALRGHLARAFLRPLTFLSGRPRDLLEWRWRRFELGNLKAVLRAVERDVPPGEARATLVPLEPVSELEWDDLVEAESVPGVVDQLSGTFYGAALQPALDRYRDGGPLLVLEVRLDLAYYRRLLEMIEDLRGRDRKEAERFLGTLIDGQNVLWAFRYRVYYGLSPEEILNYCLHRGVKVDVETIRWIAQGARVVDVLRDVWGEELTGLDRMEGLSSEEAITETEALFDRYLFDQAQGTRGAYAMHLGIVLGYEVLLETEVRDLVTIAEGKAVNWSAADIRPYLVTARETGI